MKTHRSRAGFSLVEVIVAAGVSVIIGSVIYGVASEALIAFGRNVSINRSYGDARRSLDRVANAMQSAGHTPILLTTAGADTTTSPAPGVRFWRYGVKPRYVIPQTGTTSLNLPALNGKTITISLASPSDNAPTKANTSGNAPAPLVGDLITVPVLGFQGAVASVSTSGGPGGTATLTFANNVSTYTSPVLAALPNVYPPISCVDWTPVAFLVIGQQLVYFPRFVPGSTSVTNPANYKVIANLIPSTATLTATLTPFSSGAIPAINVDLYAEAPDYNNRKLGTADTYTYLQTALAPRNPLVLRSPF